MAIALLVHRGQQEVEMRQKPGSCNRRGRNARRGTGTECYLHDHSHCLDHQDLGLIEVNLDGVWVVARPLAKGFDGLSLDLWTEACSNLRRRFEAEAELTQDIIDQAFADFSEEDRAASQRLGLSALAPTKADVERNREHLWLGLEVVAGITPTVSRKKRGLLDGVIARAEVAPRQLPEITSAEDDAEKTMPISRPHWRMEDGQ
ncbi:hypothetical protein [Aliiroseovarius crassostreae]|uniref:hypothetical protein n=1 Tax=Aliiroseovarius crassostreae TaxID=154981 RepID=UPI003C7C2D11